MCCACENAPEVEGLKDFFCSISAEHSTYTNYFCEASEPWVVEVPEGCTWIWECDSHEAVPWCRWDCDLRASEELSPGSCLGHGLDNCCY